MTVPASSPKDGAFRVHVPEPVLDDLKRRLGTTRWPTDAPAAGWLYGASLEDMQRLTKLWAQHDWRATEDHLNRHQHDRVASGPSVLHAMRVPACKEPAGAVLLLHGWPSSFLEFLDLAELPADPPEHHAPAFDVVVPSLPGFGLSDGLTVPAESATATADGLVHLLDVLEIEAVWIHASDIAAGIAVRLAQRHPDRVLGYHTTEPGLPRAPLAAASLTEEEWHYLALAEAWDHDEGGYAAVQRTRPQTLAYGLSDSPVGLAAWLFEKWHAWTVTPGQSWDWATPLLAVLLDTLTLYWATGCISGANRSYYGKDVQSTPLTAEDRVTCPVGVALTSQLIERAPRRLAERLFTDIRVWTDLGQGGHFLAAEDPQLLADNLRRLVLASPSRAPGPAAAQAT